MKKVDYAQRLSKIAVRAARTFPESYVEEGREFVPHTWVIVAMRWAVEDAMVENIQIDTVTSVQNLAIDIPSIIPPLNKVANLRQVGGEHYKVGGEEHWDRVRRLKLDYMQACITKYVERHKGKNGIQDLEKAAHYLEKYIEQEKERLAAEEPGKTYIDQDK